MSSSHLPLTDNARDDFVPIVTPIQLVELFTQKAAARQGQAINCLDRRLQSPELELLDGPG